jgi:hypothetical protein
LLHLRLSRPGVSWTSDLSDQILRFFCALVRSEPAESLQALPSSTGTRRYAVAGGPGARLKRS